MNYKADRRNVHKCATTDSAGRLEHAQLALESILKIVKSFTRHLDQYFEFRSPGKGISCVLLVIIPGTQ